MKAYFEGFVYKNLLFTVDVYRSITYELSRNDYQDVNLKKSGLSTFEPFENETRRFSFQPVLIFALRFQRNRDGSGL